MAILQYLHVTEYSSSKWECNLIGKSQLSAMSVNTALFQTPFTTFSVHKVSTILKSSKNKVLNKRGC